MSTPIPSSTDVPPVLSVQGIGKTYAGPVLADISLELHAGEVLALTGEKQVNAVGYCIGGTLLGAALAHMAAKGDTRVAAATFFAAQHQVLDTDVGEGTANHDLVVTAA